TLPTAVKKFQRLLTANGEALLSGEALRALTVFNFNGATPAPGAKGGATKAANIETFPILTGLGISTTLGFLDACGINTPHVHPRATEFLTVVEGKVNFGYILENGLVAAGNNQEIAGTLNKFEGTVFPMGSIHYQINPECKPAVFVATLNSEDPGTSQVAQNFFGLNPDVVNATLGFPKTIDGKNIEQFRKTIPANIAQDIDICLAKCQDQGQGQ
ncbi:RmlC-like cupin, partial [Trematosphaeria pertusa]